MNSITVVEITRSENMRAYQIVTAGIVISLCAGGLAFSDPDEEDKERFKMAGPSGATLVEALRTVSGLGPILLFGRKREVAVVGRKDCDWHRVRETIIRGLQNGQRQETAVTIEIAGQP